MGRQTFDPRKLLPEFDNFLHQKGVKFKTVIIGSGALTIMGFIQRHTVDIDCLKLLSGSKIKKLILTGLIMLILK